MVLYRSPDQTDLHTYEDSAKFTALRFMYKFYSPAPTPYPLPPTHKAMFFLFNTS